MPLAKRLVLFLFLCNVFFSCPVKAEEKELNLATAIWLATENSPELAIFTTQKKIDTAKMVQASTIKNPEFSGDLENIGGSPEVTGGYQLTMKVVQLFENSEKRLSRVKVAELAEGLTALNQELKKQEIRLQVAKVFNEVLSAQEQLKIMDEILKLNQEIFSAVIFREKTGRSSKLETSKARVSLTDSEMEREKSWQMLMQLRKKLAFLIGEKNSDFGPVSGNFYQLKKPQELEVILENISTSPKISLFPAEKVLRQEIWQSETLKTKPDLSVNGGYRLFDITKKGNLTFLAGVSLPLPIFNNNQGAITEALLQLEKLEAEKKIFEYQLKNEIIAIYPSFVTKYDEIVSLKEKLIPQAEKVFTEINSIYSAGKLNQLDLLTARQTLLQLKLRQVRVIGDYQSILAEIENILVKEI